MTRQRNARDIYDAIMAAAERGAGLHLSADEVYELSRDAAIKDRAIAVAMGESHAANHRGKTTP